MTTKTPNTFGLELTTVAQRLMVDIVPVGKVRHFTQIQVTSIDPANSANATIYWIRSAVNHALLWQSPVPVADAIPAIVGAFSLEAGDDLTGLASANGDIHVTVVYYDEDVV